MICLGWNLKSNFIHRSCSQTLSAKNNVTTAVGKNDNCLFTFSIWCSLVCWWHDSVKIGRDWPIFMYMLLDDFLVNRRLTTTTSAVCLQKFAFFETMLLPDVSLKCPQILIHKITMRTLDPLVMHGHDVLLYGVFAIRMEFANLTGEHKVCFCIKTYHLPDGCDVRGMILFNQRTL